ncbi:glycosyltransferase family 4 protein [Microbacterium sp. Marseille-Q6965]|uniref:glycosyltransferase family 4 protein n=1 Tax=Microbacterium sp. Marseille-Q6965 TaxID=2965072 RepID=UPI0021B7FABB|nr:glycosyltransferase family 4 protein [Microbacterium sp. Marseille-Q6965]
MTGFIARASPPGRRARRSSDGRVAASAASSRRPRVLVLANTLFPTPDPSMPGGGPRSWMLDVDADIVYVDRALGTDPPRWLRALYRRVPMRLVQVLEALRVGPRFDAVFCWSVADVALVLALLCRISRRRMRIVALLTRISERKKAVLLRAAHPRLDRIILPPVTQREFAVRSVGVPADALVALPWTLDTAFWAPVPADGLHTICAAGGEMRDYPTLVRALDGLDIPCHIAGVLDTSRPDWWNAADGDRRGEADAPPHVTFGTMSAEELRDLYARSRFVVVPLRPTDSDNGITCMNEAWAMGKAVIVSAVAGQRGAFVDGVEGVWVPAGDHAALRQAILALWRDPERAARMGAAGRRKVEAARDHRVFSEGVSAVLHEVAGLSRRADRAGAIAPPPSTHSA